MDLKKNNKKGKKFRMKKSVGVKTTPERFRLFRTYCRLHNTNMNHLVNTFITECINEMQNKSKRQENK
jgi:hypothetical protein